jgi:hypothetical protein
MRDLNDIGAVTEAVLKDIVWSINPDQPRTAAGAELLHAISGHIEPHRLVPKRGAAGA